LKRLKKNIFSGMKQILLFIALFTIFSASLQSQSLEEADRLLAGKKYKEAAAIYYQQHYFNKAIQTWQMEIDALVKAKKPQEAELLKPLQKQAEKLARMVSRCEDIQIIDSVIVDKKSFLKAYFVGDETGTFEQKNNTVVYENQLKDKRFFGKINENGLFRLYSQVKIQDNWAENKLLNLTSDNEANDNYPFVMPDGLTIYYASTGNGSIGGYDLFVSRYNLANDTYLTPNQLSMPFNSVYNDYMMVIDEVNGIGYFASDRFQPDDKVVVYTFIPNNVFKPLNNQDERTLRNRALITSIRDTWRPGVDYKSMLAKIKSDIEKEQNKIIKDFTFVINDNTVYHTLTDFKSDAAKNSFLKTKEMENNIKSLEDRLDAQRKEYSKADNAKRQSLMAPIIANEQRLETLYNSLKILTIETRNSEIRYLRINN